MDTLTFTVDDKCTGYASDLTLHLLTDCMNRHKADAHNTYSFRLNTRQDLTESDGVSACVPVVLVSLVVSNLNGYVHEQLVASIRICTSNAARFEHHWALMKSRAQLSERNADERREEIRHAIVNTFVDISHALENSAPPSFLESETSIVATPQTATTTTTEASLQTVGPDDHLMTSWPSSDTTITPMSPPLQTWSFGILPPSTPNGHQSISVFGTNDHLSHRSSSNTTFHAMLDAFSQSDSTTVAYH